jgi:hypothetical protein
VLRGISLELRRLEYAEVRLERGQVERIGADEHVAHEQRVPRGRRDETNPHAVGRVRARVQILNEQLWLLVQMPLHVSEQEVELLRVERDVDLPPPHILRRRWLAHDELVVR